MGLATAARNIGVNAIGVIALRASLHTANPGATGANEVTGGSPAYARQVVAWNPATAGTATLTADATFNIPAGTTPTHAGFWTTAGTWLGSEPLVPSPGQFAVQGTFVLDAASVLGISDTLMSAYDLAVLASGPVAYLPLSDGDWGDVTDHGHDATPHNNPTGATFLDGSGAARFNGVDQYAEIPDNDALGPWKTGIFGIGAWMRPDAKEFAGEGSGDYVYWLAKIGFPNASEWACRMYPFTTPGIDPQRPNRISGYAFNLSGGLGAGSYVQDPIADPVAGVGQEWVFVFLVINTIATSATYPTGYTKIYKNGFLRMQRNLIDYDIVVGNGTAAVRLATATLGSFWPGALRGLMFLDYEPSAQVVHDLYRMIVPAQAGSIEFRGHVGKNTATTSGTKLSIVVGEGGVSAGSTLLVSCASQYTSGAPSCADSRGNLFVLDRTSANSALTMRMALFSAQIHAALQPGDVIQMTLPTAVVVRTMSVNAFSGITFTTPLDQQNTGQGTSTTPGASTQITTTNADDLIFGMNMVNGPIADSYTEDTINEYAGLERVGASGGGFDLTVNTAFKAIPAIATVKYQGVLGTSRPWGSLVAGYKAGPAVPVPPVTGSTNHISFVAENTATGSGTTLVLTIPAGDGVPAGHTVFVTTHADYTSGGPTCGPDSRENTYTRDRTTPATGNTSRMALFSGPIATALVPGDTITITYPAAVTRRVATAESFAGVATPVVMDGTNNNSNTGTSPLTTLPLTTNADDLLFLIVAVEGPVTEAFEPDVLRQWTSLRRAGTTGGGASSDDRTINTAYRSVGATGTYTHGPTLGASAKYIIAGVVYKAGAFSVEPPPTGTGALVKALDTDSADTAGTTLTLIVPAGGVPADNTVIVTTAMDYSSSAPIVTDARGHTYVRDKTGGDGANTIRTAIFSARVTTPLQAGDAITVTSPSLTRRAAAANEFTGVLVPTVVDNSNASSGSTATPTTQVVTSNLDDLIVVALGVCGDVADGYTNDTANAWQTLTRVGTTGAAVGLDRTLNSAYRSVGAAGTFAHHPTLETARVTNGVVVAYQGG